MRKLIGGTVGALALVASLATPAEAHNYDTTSLATCYAERVEWTQSATVTHSHPVEMTGAYVDYHCCLDLGGLSHRWNFSTRWWNGATTSHDWSPVYGGWCP